MRDPAQLILGLSQKLPDFVAVVGAARDVDQVGQAFQRIVYLVRDRGGEAAGGGEFFGSNEGAFGDAAFGDIAENQDDADHAAGAVADRRAAVVDGDLAAVPRDENGVIGEADDGSEPAHLVYRIFDRGSRVFVEDGKDLMQRSGFGLGLPPAGKPLGDGVHEDEIAVEVAGDHRVADAAEGGVEPLLAVVRLFAFGPDLAKLALIDGGQAMEDSSRLPRQQKRDERGGGDQADSREPIDVERCGRTAVADPIFRLEEIFGAGSHFVHALFAPEQQALHLPGIGGRLDLLSGVAIPTSVLGLQALQALDLVRLATLKIEEGIELRVEPPVRFAQGLQEDGIAGQQKAAQPGLFIDDQLDETVGMSDRLIGVIDGAGALFDALKTVAENQSQESQRRNGKSEKTNQKSLIELRFHSIFPQCSAGFEPSIVYGRDDILHEQFYVRRYQAWREGLIPNCIEVIDLERMVRSGRNDSDSAKIHLIFDRCYQA